MHIEIDHKTSTATGQFGRHGIGLSMTLEGRKSWPKLTQLKFETSEHNKKILLGLFPEAKVTDKRTQIVDMSHFDLGSSLASTAIEYRFRMTPLDFQLENFKRFKDLEQWAIFSEQGTGKTKVAYDIICYRFLKGMVTGVLVLSSPKGVHLQWVKEQQQKHLWENVDAQNYAWDNKKPPHWVGKPSNSLQIISGNIDMVRSKKALEILQSFADVHGSKLLILVDESDSIKNMSSIRAKNLRLLASKTRQRSIMTGTPIAVDLTDEFGQFYFLNPDIIGHKYITSFRAQYCVMGGFEGRAVIGHKNVEQFKAITAPYIFRATKAELNLPAKVYNEVVFDLSSEQRKMIKDIKENFFATLHSGEEVSAGTGATAMLRIQQISNGFVQSEENGIMRLENPRMEQLHFLRKQVDRKMIIWGKFREDIRWLLDELKGEAVSIYGGKTQNERDEAKKHFIDGDAKYLVATTPAAGRGVDGLQLVCSDTIYYSHTYSAIDRWQSEDRTDRMGAIGASTYHDLIARGSIDRAIINNLKQKKSLSSFVLDDIAITLGQDE